MVCSILPIDIGKKVHNEWKNMTLADTETKYQQNMVALFAE